MTLKFISRGTIKGGVGMGGGEMGSLVTGGRTGDDNQTQERQ